MFDLLMAIFSSSMVSITMRLSSTKVRNGLGQLAANYITCSVFAAYYILGQGFLPTHKSLPHTLMLGTVAGAVYLAGFVLFQLSIKRNGVVLSSAFMKLGLIVPIVMSVLFFGEKPTLFQILGFAAAVCAIVIINSEKGSAKMSFRVGLLLLLFFGGLADGMSKVYEETGEPLLSGHFLFYTFFAAFLFCLVIIIRQGICFEPNDLKYGALVGIPNFFSSRFLLKALDSIDAVIAYPTFSAGTLLVVTVAGVLFFGERLEKKQWFALFLILVSLMLLNL